ncbi:MAG: NAD-dependent protein deacylase [Actinomycetota bacterium]|nr:NAD-dependent protein deacylase [Actinomycetota bacterium]
MERAAEAIAGGDVVAFTGAGISAESGIPTFRDPGGLWSRFDPDRFGTWEGLSREAMTRPDGLAEFLAALRRAMSDAKPNPAHHALATLERAGLVNAVLTQNVDGLHQEAGSEQVVEIHGSLLERRCLACGCAERVPRREFLAGLDHAIRGLRTAFVPSLLSLLPRCANCDAPTRPGTVAFGEQVRDFERAEGLAGRCRTMLVVGTSGEVEPAAGLPRRARELGALVIHVGPGPTWVTADVEITAPAGRVLPELAARALAATRAAGRSNWNPADAPWFTRE